jgi:ABC-type Fe3+-hydroxamate transport system substrate-binding protein
VCVLLLSLLGAGCGADTSAARDDRGTARAVAVTDDAGREIRLSAPARRVVALLPSATETLLAIGAGDRLVARTDYDLGMGVDHLPSVGGGLTPSLELLASLRPDLVIAWEEAGGARIRPRLEAMEIPVFAMRTEDTTAIFANLERFGRLTDREAAADSVARGIRARLDEVRASVASLPSPTVLYLIGTDPPMIAGPGVFIGQLIEVAGGRSAFPEVRANSPQMSLEEIVRRRPEVILLPAGADTLAAVARLRAMPGWRELLADGRTRVRTLPSDVMHRPGPSIAEAVVLIRDAIHGPAATPPR